MATGGAAGNSDDTMTATKVNRSCPIPFSPLGKNELDRIIKSMMAEEAWKYLQAMNLGIRETARHHRDRHNAVAYLMDQYEKLVKFSEGCRQIADKHRQ